VRAGLPQPTTQEAVEFLTLDDLLIDDPNRTSLHRVRGDSMRDAGILEGDLVVVEHNTPTKPGDIVIACVDSELTVKTLRMDTGGQYFLEPANPSFKPLHPRTSLEVLGVVIGVVRRVRR
jgi:repressor LexA